MKKKKPNTGLTDLDSMQWLLAVTGDYAGITVQGYGTTILTPVYARVVEAVGTNGG